MNNKTEQALTDALIDQIESAARESFRRHQRSIKGQTLTAADNYDWHLLHAAYQAGIDTLRAQLAEAQRDSERWGFFRQASVLPIDDKHPLSAFAERLTQGGVSVDDVDAAIDAAKGETR